MKIIAGFQSFEREQTY